jgi:TPR repeat protein
VIQSVVADLSTGEGLFTTGSEFVLAGDYEAAFKDLSKSVELGNSEAKAALGFLYFNGYGCDKDHMKTRSLYEESAKEGAHQGLNNLAHLYRFGLAELEVDLDKTIELLSKSTLIRHFNFMIQARS